MKNKNMFIPAAIILLLIIIVVPFSSANPSIYDDLLIAFIKNDQEIQMISEYTMKKQAAYLGIVYFMRKNWQCDKIGAKFEQYERTECQKYRKYLDILYEYLYREYAAIPTAKPNFVIKKKQIGIEGPLIYVLNCLVRISQFYFYEPSSLKYECELNKFLQLEFEPKLLNEERFNYRNDPLMTINKLILKLATVTANGCRTTESVEGIIRQNFEKYLKKIFGKAEENAREGVSWLRTNQINDDKHHIILYSKFDDFQRWIMRLIY